MRARFFGMLSVVLVVLGGCGASVQFTQERNAAKYKALKLGTPVQIVDKISDLPPPVAVLGSMALTTKKLEDKSAVEGEFKRTALRYGCDAVAEIANTVDEKKSSKEVKKLKPDGTFVMEIQETVALTVHWTARCVRTAAVGLNESPVQAHENTT